jgi:hypothetical protein
LPYHCRLKGKFSAPAKILFFTNILLKICKNASLCARVIAIVTKPKQNFIVKLRATGALLALLLGAVFAPVTLATQAVEEVCAMSCCIAEQHCCCKPAKLAVKGQKRDASEKQLASAELSKPCPEGCATGRWLSKLYSRAFLRTAITQFDLRTTAAIHPPPVLTNHNSVDLLCASPRAPPSDSLNFSA